MVGAGQAVALTDAIILVGILVITYVGIIHKEFDKVLAAALGGFFAILAGHFLGIPLVGESSDEGLIRIHDLLILGVILGNLMMVEVATQVGIFQYISIKLLKQTKGDPIRLFWLLGILTMVLSAIVNTISAILVVGALTFVICDELGYDPWPYILMEIIVTNTGGLTTLISSPTNLIIGVQFNIGYLAFLKVSLFFGLPMFLLVMYAFLKLVPIEFELNEEVRLQKIEAFDEWSVVRDRNAFYRTSVAFVFSMLSFMFSDTLGIELAVLAIGGALLMVLASGKSLDSTFAKLDWSLLAFFQGLFVIIASLEEVGVMEAIAGVISGMLGEKTWLAAIIVLWASAIISGILDNIVLAAALAPVLRVATQDSSLNGTAIAWALILGTNLGGGFTPIGAPPVVLGLSLYYKKTGRKIGWIEFFKVGGTLTILRLLLSTVFIVIYTLIVT